jgi:hypothetical protein
LSELQLEQTTGTNIIFLVDITIWSCDRVDKLDCLLYKITAGTLKKLIDNYCCSRGDAVDFPFKHEDPYHSPVRGLGPYVAQVTTKQIFDETSHKLGLQVRILQPKAAFNI